MLSSPREVFGRTRRSNWRDGFHRARLPFGEEWKVKGISDDGKGVFMKRLFWGLLPLWDFVMALFIFPAAHLLKVVRKVGVERMPFCKRALLRVGVFPIHDHYYEPLFDHRTLRRPLAQDRALPGIDWNTEEQLRLLKSFCYNEELSDVSRVKVDELSFYLDNKAFLSGDAEYLYNLIRLKKPERIVEIGSGNSTLMARKAVRKNTPVTSANISASNRTKCPGWRRPV
jgi:hypothetical protein